MKTGTSLIIDQQAISNSLNRGCQYSEVEILEILQRARQLKGLEMDDVAALCSISNPDLLSELFKTAKDVKEKIYGRRLVMFTPLYVSNLCGNDCAYCAFRSSNRGIVRRALKTEEIASETASLINEGHKRVLLVAGEAYPKEGFDYVLKAIDTVYSVKQDNGEIRRVNVNVAPLELEEFKRLKEHNIGTYQIFQETYDRQVYSQVHLRGPKANFDWRLSAMDRAFEAGIDDVGIGVLFGLADWKYEVLAMYQHINHLENRYGIGPHTISVPRLEPATGADIASNPPHPVSDLSFQKIVAVLRLMVPYTGIIMSTRETAEIRRETFALGVSQISAGSKTNPGGYSEANKNTAAQFSLGDVRSLDEVVADVARLGYTPSFCTGCYRLGRTGSDFMDLARPGEIKKHCDPNGLSSFLEYLTDYGQPETQKIGMKQISNSLEEMDEVPRRRAVAMLDKIRNGRRDIFC
ncbi:MAG: [FeFe] hydrogenase H-cluster radical SAM maturase HydG [bacterium]|nr:[FeFe] hydrogenase H-cluster radical SAM maturase HydG [bacterium]